MTRLYADPSNYREVFAQAKRMPGPVTIELAPGECQGPLPLWAGVTLVGPGASVSDTVLLVDTDLSAFAPAGCGYGHDLRVGAGHRRVSWITCDCEGTRGMPGASGHVSVKCAGCEDAGREVRFYDPPHVEAQ